MANSHNRVWSGERVERLKQLHAEGVSCSIIAAQLGCGLSRNSIIGKLHRIGLKPVVAEETLAPRGRRRPLRPEIPLTQRRTLLELGQHDCRWPFGNPESSEFFCCGAPAVAGLPYCRAHCERAYQPSRMASASPRWRIL
jgi:GcrA cell cycle regulator